MRSAVVAGVQQTTFVDIQMNDGAVTEAVEVTGLSRESADDSAGRPSGCPL